MRAARSLASKLRGSPVSGGEQDTEDGAHTPRPVIVDGQPAALVSSGSAIWRQRTEYQNLHYKRAAKRSDEIAGDALAEEGAASRSASSDTKEEKRRKARDKVCLPLSANVCAS